MKKLLFACALLAAPVFAAPVWRCKLRDGRVDGRVTKTQCAQVRGEWLVVPSPWPESSPEPVGPPRPTPKPLPTPRPSPR